MNVSEELLKIARDIQARSWEEDEDADEYRHRVVKEAKRHTDGEPVETALKIRGDWFIMTTELGAYRILRAYRKGWESIGQAQGDYRGWWYVNING